MHHVHHLGDILIGIRHFLGQGGTSGPADENALVFEFPAPGLLFLPQFGSAPVRPRGRGAEGLRHGFFGPHQHTGGGAHDPALFGEMPDIQIPDRGVRKADVLPVRFSGKYLFDDQSLQSI